MDDVPDVDAHDSLDFIFNDHGPWTRYLAEAWQQTSVPEHAIASRRPQAGPDGHIDVFERAAYWAPLLHLSSYALGWTRPEIGFWRWEKMGRPREDPILATIDSRYGQDLEMMYAWLAWSGANRLRSDFFGLEPEINNARGLPSGLETISRRMHEGPWDRFNKGHFAGSGDPLHLVDHLELQRHSNVEPTLQEVDLQVDGETTDYVLIGHQVPSLFRFLDCGVPRVTNGRSTRVGLLCPPIGWLGIYRNSRETDLWFRGKHRWHTLGNSPFGSLPSDTS